MTRPEDLACLCRSCGLCCDGSLFGRVGLRPEEVAAARKNGLRVLHDGRAFEQPCRALTAATVDGRRDCAAYDERPRACRTFACRLYDRHRREGGPLEPRLAAVRRVRELVARLEASGLKPADFDAGRYAAAADGPRGALASAYAELVQRLEEDFARASEPQPR